jgi:hypothetical protein
VATPDYLVNLKTIRPQLHIKTRPASHRRVLTRSELDE